MGNTFDALKRAEKEHTENLHDAFQVNHLGKITVLPHRSLARTSLNSYEDLKANLLTRYPELFQKVILFTSPTHGEGSSTTASNFSLVLAKDAQKKILLVDANLMNPCLHEIFKIDRTPGLSEILSDDVKSSAEIMKIGAGNFYVMPCGKKHSRPATLFDSKRFRLFLSSVRERFDYVILDAPPVSGFSESRIICSNVDGVVLVIGAGKTRKQVALKAKTELEEAGGKVFGIVLNRRKFHIPNWIYRRL